MAEPPKSDGAPNSKELGPGNLLRFISRDLDVQALVAREGKDYFVELVKEGQVIAKRRLAKAKCCRSDSPCIGTIPIPASHQIKYDLPSFVHVSLCYDQISEFFDRQNQTYPKTF